MRPALSGPEQLLATADGRFLVHYTLAGADAPPHGAADADAVVQGISRISQHGVDQVGMRAPLPDGGDGGDARVDVYLRALGGPRGLTHPEEVGAGDAASAWIEVDPASAGVSVERLAAAAGH